MLCCCRGRCDASSSAARLPGHGCVLAGGGTGDLCSPAHSRCHAGTTAAEASQKVRAPQPVRAGLWNCALMRTPGQGAARRDAQG